MDVFDDDLPLDGVDEDMPESVYLGIESVDDDDLPLGDDDSQGGVVSSTLGRGYFDDDELQKRIENYNSKNDYLRGSSMFRELNTEAFLRLIFCRGDDFDFLPFEEEWCEAYAWWTEHERSAKRPARFSYVYNGIAQAIYGKRQKEHKNKTFVITSQAERLYEILQHPFVIMSPISYTGKRRTKNNARYLYAIGIDIDNNDGDNVDNLIYQSDPTRAYITFPQPQIIVNSGGGIHIYYLLETPAPMFKDAYAILNKIKKELTRRVWNKGTTHNNPEKPQFQGNCQGFRLPGTQTKFYTKVTAFQNLNPNVKPYYTISDLAFGGGGWITEEELNLVKKGTYNPSRVTLAQARELYPEWYERRIIQGHRPNRWYIKRDLYDWWKEMIFKYATVGHRYFCLMALAVYAKKCNISEKEFRTDLEGFVEVMDGLSYTRKPEDRFMLEDALDAAAAFQENYCTFPLDDIRAITGVPVERNRTRKFRKQEEHLFDARAVRDARCAKVGVSWSGNGRKTKSNLVLEWRTAHPGGTKYACEKELGIDKKTVMRWWNTTEEDLLRYEEEKARVRSSRLAANTTTEEPHELGAATSSNYITDKKTMAGILRQVPGNETLSSQERTELEYDLADTINWSDAQLEEMYKAAMGIPEAARPFVRIDPDIIRSLREEMSKPYDYSEDLKNLPELMNQWPDELKKLITGQIEARNKK